MSTATTHHFEKRQHIEKKKYHGTTQQGLTEFSSTFAVQILLYFVHGSRINFVVHEYIFRLCWVCIYVGLSLRWFMIFHDCGHSSFTDSLLANRILHHASSIFCLTPSCWSKGHLSHHLAHGGLTNTLFRWNYTVFHTKQWFVQQSISQQFLYALFRNPIVTFLVRPFLLWIVKYPLLSFKQSYALENIARSGTSACLFYTLWRINGTQCLIDCAFGTYFAMVLGLMLFHVQHSYEPAYTQRMEGLPFADSALFGSCLIEIPWFLKWFSMGIEYHHIHHLNTKVPGYLLQDCHNDAPEAYRKSVTCIGCADFWRTLKTALYDEERKLYVGLPYFAILSQVTSALAAWTSRKPPSSCAISVVLLCIFVAPSLFWSLKIRSVSILLTTFLLSWIVRYLGKKHLLYPSPLTPHIAALSTEQRKECIADLNKMFSHRDLLCSFWSACNEDNDNVRMVILLTGVTGYVGKAVLYQLLSLIKEVPPSRVDQHPKVLLLVRSNLHVSAEDRVEALRRKPIFSDLQGQWRRAIEVVEMSSTTLLNCGISAESIQNLGKANITHLVHCAGDVTFDRPMGDLAAANITFSLQLQAFAKKWPTFQRMVYVATAFVNPNSGTKNMPLQQTLVDLHGIDPVEVYRSMVEDDRFAIAMKVRLGFQNNYAFSKCIAEHLLARDSTIELWIAQPSVVGPSWVLPFPAWNGDRPSTITALGLLIRLGCIRFIGGFDHPAPLIPVDIVAAGIIYGMVGPIKSLSLRTPNLNIMHLTCWSVSSTKKFPSFKELIEQAVRFWTLSGQLSVSEGILTLGMENFAMDKSNFTKTFLRLLINRWPTRVLLAVARSCSIFGFSIFGSRQQMTCKILKSVKLADLYYPYLEVPFFFEGSVCVPASLNHNQYLYSTIVAIERFLAKATGIPPQETSHLVELVPLRRSD